MIKLPINLSALSKLSPREKKILYVVIGLLVLVFGYHGIWTPMNQKFGELDQEIFALQMRLRKAKTFIRQKDQVLEASKKFSNLEQMDAGSDEEEIARLLNFIEQTARKNGVSLSDVKPQPVQSDKVTKQYQVELNAEANLASLTEFIYELEHSAQMLRLGRVTINPKEDGSPTLRAFLSVTRVVVK
jgi:Tfp pilus assembly protein PilO